MGYSIDQSLRILSQPLTSIYVQRKTRCDKNEVRDCKAKEKFHNPRVLIDVTVVIYDRPDFSLRMDGS